MSQSHTTREGWLIAAADELRTHLFLLHGMELVSNFRVSCGFPVGSPKSVGQCWNDDTSVDEMFSIFISPVKDDPQEVLLILLHELIHAQVGLGQNHGGEFKRVARLFGFEGKLTESNTTHGGELHTTLEGIARKLGHYPHGSMERPTKASKPSPWKRYVSVTNDEFKVIANIKKVEEHGAPRDPWGEEMELVEA